MKKKHHNMPKHTMKVSNWENGKLKVEKEECESLEEAILKSKKFVGYVKIYDHREQVVHSERREASRDHSHGHHHDDHDEHESYA